MDLSEIKIAARASSNLIDEEGESHNDLREPIMLMLKSTI
jgi:hypothetical protein